MGEGRLPRGADGFDVCTTSEGFGLIRKKGEQAMFAYELYWFDKTEKPHFMGMLRERRENLLRITRESVLDLGRKVMGDDVNVAHLYFIQVELE